MIHEAFSSISSDVLQEQAGDLNPDVFSCLVVLPHPPNIFCHTGFVILFSLVVKPDCCSEVVFPRLLPYIRRIPDDLLSSTN